MGQLRTANKRHNRELVRVRDAAKAGAVATTPAVVEAAEA